MKAIAHDKYGAADELELRNIDKPEIGHDEVLVRVHAAGLDRGVWHIMTGLPYPIRLAGFGVRAPKNPVLGMDMGGREHRRRRDRIQTWRRSLRRRKGFVR
jgi:NADPH:quinone reductase-like Zn-dependent oxidoreductase